MLNNFLLTVVNFILPPRRTQEAVECLTLDELLELQTADGLPYAREEVRSLVWEIKYHANKRAAGLAGELLSEELLAVASEELGRPLLIPVPMHTTRRRERGHNQTELLCEAALEALNKNISKNSLVDVSAERRPEDFFDDIFDYAPIALRRIKLTPEQQKLSRAERLTNLKNSMQADPDIVKGRVCVVVDDVTTTGATLAEAKRALKEAGAARVHTLALAQS